MRKTRQMTSQLFRVEAAQPFDASLLNLGRGTPPRHSLTGATSGAPLRITHCAKTRAIAAQAVVQNYSDDSEREYLLDRRNESQRDVMSLSASITLCSAVVLWLLIASAVGVMYWQVTSGVSAVQMAASPYFGKAINRTMSILQHVDDSSIGASNMVEGAQAITNLAVPTMQLALNQTAAMILRLERLAANPVMQISLAGAAAGPAG